MKYLMMMPVSRASDEELLVQARMDDAAFAVFYERHERSVLAFFIRAVGRPKVAVDLTAEAFAEIVVSRERFDPKLGSASAWLFGIARNVLARSRRRGRVENRARLRLGLSPLAVDDEMLERVEQIAGEEHALGLLAMLPAEQREAVRARVLDEREYVEIARELACSESVVRKRVSRGLATLRRQMKEEA